MLIRLKEKEKMIYWNCKAGRMLARLKGETEKENILHMCPILKL